MGWEQKRYSAFLLRGEKGSGKSHLSHIWAEKYGASYWKADEMLQNSPPEYWFNGRTHLVVEDIEKLTRPEYMFHLLNYVANGQPERCLLLTIDTTQCWDGIELPDLRSRLQALPQAEIPDPDDMLLCALLVKAFQDRQWEVDHALIHYAATRMPRSFSAVYGLIMQLQEHIVRNKKPLNRLLLREILTNY